MIVTLWLTLRTMNVTDDAAILTIGAVLFDPRGEDTEEEMTARIKEGRGFSQRASLESNMKIGRSCSASTICWWLEQSEDARHELIHGKQYPIGLVLKNFRQWITGFEAAPTRVWAKDPDFDCNILVHAMKQTHEIWPFPLL